MQSTIDIYIRCVDGVIITLDVKLITTIGETKAMIKDKKYFPLGEQFLIHASKVLEDNKTLDDYNIGKCSNIQHVNKPDRPLQGDKNDW